MFYMSLSNFSSKKWHFHILKQNVNKKSQKLSMAPVKTCNKYKAKSSGFKA